MTVCAVNGIGCSHASPSWIGESAASRRKTGMLTFDPVSRDSGERTRTTRVRHDDGLVTLVVPTAIAQAMGRSVLLRAMIKREATRVLNPQCRHLLTREVRTAQRTTHLRKYNALFSLVSENSGDSSSGFSRARNSMATEHPWPQHISPRVASRHFGPQGCPRHP